VNIAAAVAVNFYCAPSSRAKKTIQGLFGNFKKSKDNLEFKASAHVQSWLLYGTVMLELYVRKRSGNMIIISWLLFKLLSHRNAKKMGCKVSFHASQVRIIWRGKAKAGDFTGLPHFKYHPGQKYDNWQSGSIEAGKLGNSP